MKHKYIFLPVSTELDSLAGAAQSGSPAIIFPFQSIFQGEEQMLDSSHY